MEVKRELELAAQRNLAESQHQQMEYNNKMLFIKQSQFEEKMKRIRYKLEAMKIFEKMKNKKKNKLKYSSNVVGFELK